MKEILFATGNESKVNRFKEKLLERGIDTLVDLDLTELFFQVYKQEK